MSTVADYIGRTVDVSAFHGVEATGEVQLRQVLAETESSGLVITGIQKLAQRFVLEFLTDQGSMKYLPHVVGHFWPMPALVRCAQRLMCSLHLS